MFKTSVKHLPTLCLPLKQKFRHFGKYALSLSGGELAEKIETTLQILSLSLSLFLPGVRRMTERMTKDITARITTIAIPMPFQFRGGPSELPRSWYEKNTHKQSDECEHSQGGGH